LIFTRGSSVLQIYLAVTPQEVRAASQYGCGLAHVAYRIGPESTLLRRDLLMNTRGGLLSLSDRDAPEIQMPDQLSGAIVRECLRRNYAGVILDFEDSPSLDRRVFVSSLAAYLARNRRNLFIPERYASSAPTASVLINTAVSGGNFTTYLRESQNRYGGRAALDLQRLIMDFTLPARSGTGRPMAREELAGLMEQEAPALFFSPDLCTRYFTFMRDGNAHFVLCDDADTLLRKLQSGGSLGFRTAFLMYPETADLLPRLFGNRPGQKTPPK
jgi:hypothetical protein